MRTFEFRDAKSHKFWNIELAGGAFTVTFGKVGTDGRVQTKEFADTAEARKAHDKLVAAKVKKGYRETTPASPLQRSIESALVEDPEDVASHMAYADTLQEHGDPRGEFVQVQLALEDAGKTPDERRQLRKREAELLRQHARTWLGGLGNALVGEWSGPDKPYHYAFRRGWVDHLRLLPAPEELFPILATSPELRLLRTLEIVYDMRYHPFDFHKYVNGPNEALGLEEYDYEMDEGNEAFSPLLESPHLGNLRVFRLGFSDADEDGLPRHSTMVRPFSTSADQVLTLLDKTPRLEELYLNDRVGSVGTLFASRTLGNLRVLQFYYGRGGPNYPLSILADNPTLVNLHTLRLHPGRDTSLALDQVTALVNSKNLPKLAHLQLHAAVGGDQVAERIVRSGILRRLKTLDLGFGNLTDAGARTLAACADLRRLEMLNVCHNTLTQDGIATLERTGVKVIADHQHDGSDENYYNVDAE